MESVQPRARHPSRPGRREDHDARRAGPPGIAAAVFEPLAEQHISVDVIVQNASAEGLTDLTFTVSKGDLARAHQPIDRDRSRSEISAGRGRHGRTRSRKVSIVGTRHPERCPGFASRMFRCLFDAGINIEMISDREDA